MFGESLQHHGVVLDPTLDQGACDSSLGRVLQHHVNVGVADTSGQIRTFELQTQHRQVLDVNGQQIDIGGALEHVCHAPVATLQLLLIERRDGLTHAEHGGIGGVGLSLDAQIVLLSLCAMALKEVHIPGQIEELGVVHV